MPSPRRAVWCAVLAPVLLVVTLLGACTSPVPPPEAVPAAPEATRTVILPSPDGDRSAIVHHPARARGKAPLVVVMHGSSGSAQAMQADLGWDALADREGFVVAYPDGVGHGWNAGRCCGRASTSGVDDVGYLDALRARLVAADGVDPDRVHAVGFSNGAMMAYTWACGRPGTLAGIGAVAGSLVVECQTPAPITVAALTGTIDKNVPIEGRSDRGWPGLDVTLAPFLAADRCPPTPVVAAGSGSERRTWSCASSRTVTRETLAGVGHGWPGGATEHLWSLLRDAAR